MSESPEGAVAGSPIAEKPIVDNDPPVENAAPVHENPVQQMSSQEEQALMEQIAKQMQEAQAAQPAQSGDANRPEPQPMTGHMADVLKGIDDNPANLKSPQLKQINLLSFIFNIAFSPLITAGKLVSSIVNRVRGLFNRKAPAAPATPAAPPTPTPA